MSGSAPPRAHAITRRQGLAGLLALLPAGAVAACSSGAIPVADVPATAEPTPELSSEVAAAEADLIARYDAVIATLAEGSDRVRSTLEAIRMQHAEHLSALGGAPTGASVAGAEAVVGSPAIAALVDAERQAAKARIGSCVEASDPELARTLAFIAASEASHVPVLRRLS